MRYINHQKTNGRKCKMQNSGRQMFTAEIEICYFTDVNGDFFSLFDDDEDFIVTGHGEGPAKSLREFINSDYEHIRKRGKISIEQKEDGRGHIILSNDYFKAIIAVTPPWVTANALEWLSRVRPNTRWRN